MTARPTTSGAATGDVTGQSVIMHYGDVAAEYAALRSSAMLIDRSARGRTRVSGAHAKEMIGGLVTNDVQALATGQGLYAAALNPKGKIVADIRVFAGDDGLLIDVPPRAYPGWEAMIRKYINPRLAPYQDVSAALRDIGIFGVRAREITSAVSGLARDVLATLPPYGHRAVEHAGHTLIVARVPDLELEGYELFIPEAAFSTIWQSAIDAGATTAGLFAWEIARIEAGRPEWGIDIDETTIPQEANFDELHAISYTKGCYVGQEVVARVHFRGHVNRHLRGISSERDEPIPERATLLDESGKQVGDVRSTTVSPRLGAIALAMVRREVTPETLLRAQWDGGEAQIEVHALPFPL
jgi:folate-binding protein YgfZ